MRVLVVFAHPVAGSFGGALHRAVVGTLREAGHEVDDCDLYGEEFDPVLTRDERLHYEEVPYNRRNVEEYVRRVLWAEAMVFCFPTWNSGPPAILKGWLDRVMLPGVAFTFDEKRKLVGTLTHVEKIAAVVTYGSNRLRALLTGDPPRKLICRAVRGFTRLKARVRYLAEYDLDNMTEERGKRFLDHVRGELRRFLPGG